MSEDFDEEPIEEDEKEEALDYAQRGIDLSDSHSASAGREINLNSPVVGGVTCSKDGKAFDCISAEVINELVADGKLEPTMACP